MLKLLMFRNHVDNVCLFTESKNRVILLVFDTWVLYAINHTDGMVFDFQVLNMHRGTCSRIKCMLVLLVLF